ncbi:lamin tail domain-containing protein [Gracilimonas sp.]|uniref:lamin tail domain-containing protein n=1 Tax=Gracilimonas sp. TaxID=1974203 RepID=UPI003BAD7E75
MRVLLFVILWGLPCIIFGQSVNFEDDFSDQDISDWTGNNSDFIFTEENGNILLQQNASGAGVSYLSIPSTNSVGYWEFFIRFDGFSPSNGNKAEIYLMSDNQDLTSSLNGYKLKGGENGSSDVFRLLRVDNGSEANEVLTGITSISSGADYRIKVTRDASGNWMLEVAEGYAGLLSVEDTGTDNTYTSTSYFGFKNTYSSTRSDLFYYDFKIDIPPIQVTSVLQVSDTELDISFSRDIDFSSVQTSDFILNPGAVIPQSVNQQSGDTTRITFPSNIPSGPNSLTISGIEDSASETILADTSFSFFVYDDYQPGDVVINEFMKDPPPGKAEYVELRNTSDRYLNLKTWQLGDNNSLSTISFSDFTLLPDSFVVVSSDTSSLNTFFGEAVYLQSSIPAFNNSGDQIRLFNQSGSLIDSLQYNADWGGEDVALERRSSTVPSFYQENWGDSPSPDFGTPGFSNQVQPDNTAPSISALEVVDSQTLLLILSERADTSTALDQSNYSISQNPEAGATPPPIPAISSVQQIAPDSLLILLDNDLQEYDGNWTLTVTNLTDIFRNISDVEADFNYYVIFTAQTNQVVINEFMYDPGDGFSEFVELYNHSDSSFNLQNWTFNDNTGDDEFISPETFVLPAGKFVVLAPDSTLIASFPGIPLIDMRSRFSSLNNSSDAIVIKNQNGLIIDSLSYEDDWGGEEISLERRTPAVTGIYRENWADSPSENKATPGLPNLVPEDETPPEIKGLSVVNDSTLQLIFSERVAEPPAINPKNYIFIELPETSGNSLLPQSFNYLAPDTVIIAFSAKIPRKENGTTYQLRVSNQTDLFGNTSGELVAEFFLIDLAEAARNDIIINEFMYEPEEDYTEFIELFNPTDKNYDLRNWTLNDNTGNRRAIATSGLEITLNSYLVLAPDSSFLELFPNRPTLILGSRFPSLNNSTDAIVIRNANGELIDSLTYTSDWGGEGVSLERRSPDHPSFYRENWGDSPPESKSTPGHPNLIEQDNEPPVLEQASITSPDSIQLIFNERVDSVLATDISHYSLSPSWPIAEVVNYKGDSLSLVLSTSLSSGDTFTLSVNNQQDIFGNTLTSATANLEYTVFSPVNRTDVIINEILYSRASAESPEFIEVYNRTSDNFNLTDWTFSDETGSTTIPEGTVIKSNEYLILTDSEEFATGSPLAKAESNGNVVYLSGFPSLNDDEDAVVIKDENGVVIDSLFYRETWGGNEPGISLERKDPESASNDAGNWASSTSQTGNSAGSQSSIYQPDQTPPEIVFAKLRTDGKIYVAFSEFVRSSGTGPVTVNENPSSIAEYDEENANILIIGNDSFPSGEPLTITFGEATDFRGNTSGELAIEVSQPLSKGNVVINEILFDPLANSDDNLPDQTEYVEFYNRADYAVSLEGFFIHDDPDENNEIRSVYPFSSQFRWIPAGGTVVFYAEDQTSVFSESRLASYFELQNENAQFFIRADRSNLSLASSGDAIYLADSTGLVFDSVFYDESWHNPNLYDVDGIALERIDPDGPSNDETNWSSSTAVSGGTPGRKNSIFQQAGAGPDDTGITFTPNPFSPDDDGFEDNLFINYKLEEPDYLLRVRIFDRYGREVKKLADGKQAGFEGSLIWDGLKDNGSKNRVGIYIVLFEAYNSTEGNNKTFKKTAVLAKKF